MTVFSDCCESEYYLLFWSCLDMYLWSSLPSLDACKFKLVQKPSKVSLLNILNITFALKVVFFFKSLCYFSPLAKLVNECNPNKILWTRTNCLPQKKKTTLLISINFDTQAVSHLFFWLMNLLKLSFLALLIADTFWNGYSHSTETQFMNGLHHEVFCCSKRDYSSANWVVCITLWHIMHGVCSQPILWANSILLLYIHYQRKC